MEKKEKNIINIVLTVVILFLAVSIAVYLLSLWSWNRKNTQASGSSGGEAVPVATDSDASASPPKAALPSIETSLIDLGDFVTFVPYAFTDDSGSSRSEFTLGSSGGLRTKLANFITIRPTGAKTDPQEAFRLYKSAADSGNAEAQFIVYAFELAGIGGAPSDPNEMMTCLSSSAANGYAPAQNELGICYVLNDNYADAAAWFEKAADQGLITARNNLGIMYYSGYGVPIDYRKAYDLFLPCAEQGIVQAQFSLGTMFEEGYGVEQDKQKAFQYYLQAASAGYAPAQTYVGDSYLHGAGVAADPKEAFYWYSLAAEQGDFSAQYLLGYMYENGIGVEKNDQMAGIWYEKSAEKLRTLQVSVSDDSQNTKSQLSPEEQLHLYRQFLLRGDLKTGSSLDAAQLRYRLYDIDEDGITELYFATTKEHGAVVGTLWLDNENRVRPLVSYVSNRRYSRLLNENLDDVDTSALIGSVWKNGKRLEAHYFGRTCPEWWIQAWLLYDPVTYRNSDDARILNGSESYSTGEYKIFGDNEFQITEEEFPYFYQQVEVIIGTGSTFDPYSQTISYEELIGNETLDPEYMGLEEYMVKVDWAHSMQFPSDRTLTLIPSDLTLDNTSTLTTSYRLPVADNAVIHVYGSPVDDFAFFHWENQMSVDEYIEDYNRAINGQDHVHVHFAKSTDEQGNPYAIGFSHAFVQIKNGEIKSIWMNPEVWG